MLNTLPMLKSLLWKEFRELLPLIIAAILVDGLLIGNAVFSRHSMTAAVYIETVWPAMFITSLLYSLAAGLFQNLREEQQGTFLFLLHRPLARDLLIATRLIYGAAICALVCAAPLLLSALWADAHNDGRLHWITPWSVAYCGQFLLIYLGAFLSSLRPARALGSRYFPLLGSILLFIFLLMLGLSGEAPDYRYVSWVFALLAWTLGPFTQLALVLAILHVARTRDYQ